LFSARRVWVQVPPRAPVESLNNKPKIVIQVPDPQRSTSQCRTTATGTDTGGRTAIANLALSIAQPRLSLELRPHNPREGLPQIHVQGICQMERTSHSWCQGGYHRCSSLVALTSNRLAVSGVGLFF